VRPKNVLRHNRQGREEEGPSDDVTKTLCSVGRKFELLTHNVPMDIVGDVPIGMQCHVMGVPRPWVRLF
jgi:hypothetical protein